MKVLVLGKGLVGKNLQKIRPEWTYWSTKDCDLLNYSSTHAILQKAAPDIIINAAGIVGGIKFNMEHQLTMLHTNTKIALNVFESVKSIRKKKECRVIHLLSTCAYPKEVPDDFYPMTEEMLDMGEPESTNKGYALHKRFVKEIIDYNRELGYRDCYLIPCNLYGPGDNYNLDQAHFVPALIRKIHYAKQNGLDKIRCWGDGTPRRQCLHVQDLCYALSDWVKYNISTCANVATEENYTIKEIVDIALEACDAMHITPVWDNNKNLNGVSRKDVSIERLERSIKWEPLSLLEGIRSTYRDYVRDNYRRL